MKPVKHCRKLIDKVLSCIDTISNLSNVTLTNFVECGVTAEQYANALGCVEKRPLYYINENHVK